MGARHYDPRTGRFLQSDPLGIQSEQRYAYAANNPYLYADPSGLSSVGIVTSDATLNQISGPGGSAFDRAFSANDLMQISIAEIGGALGGLSVGEMGLFSGVDGVGYVTDTVVGLAELNSGLENGGARSGARTLMEGALAFTLVDDATVVGSFDDVLIPFLVYGLATQSDQLDGPIVQQTESGRYSKQQREEGFEESKGTDGTPRCDYCGGEMTDESGHSNSYEADHRIPYIDGGETIPENRAERAIGERAASHWGPGQVNGRRRSIGRMMKSLPSNLAVYVCGHVFENSRPILLVCLEEGDYQFLYGEDHPPDDRPHVVGVGHLLERDPTLEAIENLHDGWEAARTGASAPWRMTPIDQ